jgi:hypothetical protein
MLGKVAMPSAPHAELCSTRVLQFPRALRGSRQLLYLRGATDTQYFIFVEPTLIIALLNAKSSKTLERKRQTALRDLPYIS